MCIDKYLIHKVVHTTEFNHAIWLLEDKLRGMHLKMYYEKVGRDEIELPENSASWNLSFIKGECSQNESTLKRGVPRLSRYTISYEKYNGIFQMMYTFLAPKDTSLCYESENKGPLADAPAYLKYACGLAGLDQFKNEYIANAIRIFKKIDNINT